MAQYDYTALPNRGDTVRYRGKLWRVDDVYFRDEYEDEKEGWVYDLTSTLDLERLEEVPAEEIDDPMVQRARIEMRQKHEGTMGLEPGMKVRFSDDIQFPGLRGKTGTVLNVGSFEVQVELDDGSGKATVGVLDVERLESLRREQTRAGNVYVSTSGEALGESRKIRGSDLRKFGEAYERSMGRTAFRRGQSVSLDPHSRMMLKSEDVFVRGSLNDLRSRLAQIRYDVVEELLDGALLAVPGSGAVLNVTDAVSFLQTVGFLRARMTAGGGSVIVPPSTLGESRSVRPLR